MLWFIREDFDERSLCWSGETDQYSQAAIKLVYKKKKKVAVFLDDRKKYEWV